MNEQSHEQSDAEAEDLANSFQASRRLNWIESASNAVGLVETNLSANLALLLVLNRMCPVAKMENKRIMKKILQSK